MKYLLYLALIALFCCNAFCYSGSSYDEIKAFRKAWSAVYDTKRTYEPPELRLFLLRLQKAVEVHNFDLSPELPFEKAMYAKDIAKLVEVGEVSKEKCTADYFDYIEDLIANNPVSFTEYIHFYRRKLANLCDQEIKSRGLYDDLADGHEAKLI